MVGRYSRIQDDIINEETNNEMSRNSTEVNLIETDEMESFDLENLQLTNEDNNNGDNNNDGHTNLLFINNNNSSNTTNINSNITSVDTIYNKIKHNIIVPVQTNIIEPLSEFERIMTRKLDKYLTQFGNPLILKRFIYMLVVSIIMWVIWRSGFIFEYSNGTTFSNHDMLLQYVNDHIDLNKFETDLQYLTSVPHKSGTRGDMAIKNYIKKYMENIHLKDVVDKKYEGYVNYPDLTNKSILSLFYYSVNAKNDEDSKIVEIQLNELNFVSLTINDQLNKTNIIYGHYGTERDYLKLTKKFLLEDPFVILLHFAPDDIIPISEQILLAQKYNAQGIIFVSNEYGDDFNDAIQQRSAGLLQYGSGDVLSVQASSHGYLDLLNSKGTKLLPYVSIISISSNQGKLIQSKFDSKGSVLFENGWYSGNGNDIQCKINVTSVIKERQPIYNVMGKIEGREQPEKAIIIGAVRNSLHPGALFPNMGLTYMLSIMGLLQELKFKYNWVPLRSIYFISFGGSEYNYIGSTEFVQKESLRLQKEIYSYIDISQLSLDQNIDIMAHPLLQTLFESFHGIESILSKNVTTMSKYGDWTPFLANGIPTAAITSKLVNNKNIPVDSFMDTFDSIQDKLHKEKYQNIIKANIYYTVGIILRLVDAPMIPFNLLHFTKVINEKVFDLKIKYDRQLNFKNIIRSLLQWKKLSQEWIQWRLKWHSQFKIKNHSIKVEEPLSISKQRCAWNLKLSHIGKKTIYEYGLPERTFYKNIIIGPPLWTGYDTTEGIDLNIDETSNDGVILKEDLWLFPGFHDAIWKEDWNSAQEQLNIISKVLNEAGHSISKESTENLKY